MLLLCPGVGDKAKWFAFFVVKDWFRCLGCRLATLDGRDTCVQILGGYVAGDAADGHDVLRREDGL